LVVVPGVKRRVVERTRDKGEEHRRVVVAGCAQPPCHQCGDPLLETVATLHHGAPEGARLAQQAYAVADKVPLREGGLDRRHEGVADGQQRRLGAGALGELREQQFPEPVGALHHHVFLGLVVAEERPTGDAGGQGDLLDGGLLEAARKKQFLGGGAQGSPHHLLLAHLETQWRGRHRLGKRLGLSLRTFRACVAHGRIVAQGVDNGTECHYHAGVVDVVPVEGRSARVGQIRFRDRSPASRGGLTMCVMRWAAVGVLGLVVGTIAAVAAPVLSEAEVAARVEALLGRMSLDEKIGQLIQVGAFDFFPGPKPAEVIRKGGAGSVLWLNDRKQFNVLQKIAVEESPSKIPLLFGLDVIHGYQTIFPVPLAVASSWDPSVAERAQAVAAKEAHAAGLHWTFGPMLDIARDARWGRIVEGAGEDTFLGAAMAAAQVRGFQGPYLGAPNHVVACAKPFAGYGAADGGRDYDPVYLPEGRLRNVYFPPFEAAVKAGVGTFMSAYMDLNDA